MTRGLLADHLRAAADYDRLRRKQCHLPQASSHPCVAAFPGTGAAV